MDIANSFGYVFEDEDWGGKVLIGGLISLVPIANVATIGYALRTMKHVAAGAPRPLPAWENLGDDVVKGLLVAAACAVYALPLFLLLAMTTLISALGPGGRDLLSNIVGLCLTSLACLTGLYGLFLGFWLPAAAVRYAEAGEFAALFRFGEIWRFMERNLGGYVVALLVAWMAGLAALLIGSALCLIGLVFTGFVAMLVWAHLLGQVVREAPEGAPAPVF